MIEFHTAFLTFSYFLFQWGACGSRQHKNLENARIVQNMSLTYFALKVKHLLDICKTYQQNIEVVLKSRKIKRKMGPFVCLSMSVCLWLYVCVRGCLSVSGICVSVICVSV